MESMPQPGPSSIATPPLQSSPRPAPMTSSSASAAATSASTPLAAPIQPPAKSDGFQFPPHYSFPPFFTLQPNLTTLSRQLALWSSLIQSYCAHHKQFRLALSTAPSSPLFHNATINRSLDVISIRRVLDYMASADGDRRAEWVTTGKKPRDGSDSKSSAWIYWKRPEEWADAVYNFVDNTGQKGTVLTVYELRWSDAVQTQEWIGMDEDFLRRCLDVLVKRGKAQIFGADEGAGIKFS